MTSCCSSVVRCWFSCCCFFFTSCSADFKSSRVTPYLKFKIIIFFVFLVGSLTASGICIFKIGILLISGKKFKAVCLSFCVTNCNPLTDLPQILIGYLFITTKMSLTWFKTLFRSPDKAVFTSSNLQFMAQEIYLYHFYIISISVIIYITLTSPTLTNTLKSIHLI